MFSSNSSQVASSSALFIEDVVSSYLYTGTGAMRTITNNIDLAGKGGLVWLKSRSMAYDHALFDTDRGVNLRLVTNTTGAQATQANRMVTAFNSDGFTLGNANTGTYDSVNESGQTFVSWTFRKAAKFFDVVTYTGNGSNNRTVSHNLGSTPGCIIVKRTDQASSIGWAVYHRSSGNLCLNTTDAENNAFNGDVTSPTSTTFTVSSYTDVNANGGTYVAYLFAHNAGGFGTAGTDNVITCGSYTTDGSGNATVNLGYEPQWFLRKRSDSTGDWRIADNMRGWTALGVSGDGTGVQQVLRPNLSNSEATFSTVEGITPTGFGCYGMGSGNETYIYIAIRRGPMKTPTSGTSVFSPIAYAGANGATQNISAGFPVDVDIIKIRNAAGRDPLNHARLMGPVFLKTDATSAQLNFSDNIVSFSAGQNVIGLPAGTGTNEVNGDSTSTYIAWAFGRAPSFMDVVCYTGTGSNLTVNHNLGVTPELIIFKNRTTAGTYWITVGSVLPDGGAGVAGYGVINNNNVLSLNTTNACSSGDVFSALPSSTSFGVSSTNVGANAKNYVAYLFASCPGVSKVTSFTGNGSTQTIDCGFSSGARFVLIKATSTTGNWLTFDTARGMTTSTDPWLALNLTSAESATTGACTTVSSGFAVDESKLTGVNTNGVSYIALAVA